MNKELANKNVTIELRSGQGIPAKEVKISNDSVSWIDLGTNKESRASTGQINKIVIKDLGLGTWEGLGLGLAGGGGLGALVGQALATPGGTETLGAGYGAAFGLIIGGAAGMLAGSIIGGITGHSDNYEFEESAQRDSTNGSPSPIGDVKRLRLPWEIRLTKFHPPIRCI